MWATIGHQKAINTLQRSLSKGRMSHAYLIAGPPNIGKMTLAMDMARMVNCLEQDKPCGECAQCKRITDDLHADVQVIGLESQDSRDGRQRIAISIDKVREVQKEASLKPYEGAYRVFIFDGAEHLSEPAANALLKILEEPPEQVILALLVSETSAVLPTIASRCQTLDLRPLPPSLLAEELESKYDSDHDTAVEIARLSGGRPGWAITALSDSAIMERRAEIIQAIEDTMRSPLDQRFAYAEKLANAFTRKREPVYNELGLWLQWWRDLLVIKEGTPEHVTNISKTDALRDISESLSSAQVVSAINAVQESLNHLERNVNPRLALENLMLSLPWI